MPWTRLAAAWRRTSGCWRGFSRGRGLGRGKLCLQHVQMALDLLYRWMRRRVTADQRHPARLELFDLGPDLRRDVGGPLLDRIFVV